MTVSLGRSCCAWTTHSSLLRRPAVLQRRYYQSCFMSASDDDRLLRIGERPIRHVMAPMVAASDFAFRCLVERHGADLCYTQMLHARNLVEDKVFCRNHLDFPFLSDHFTPSQRDCIGDGMTTTTRIPDEHAPGPLIVQLAGHDPDTMVQAAMMLLEKDCQFEGIDVNLGCPQAIARKGRYGAFLLEDNVALVCQILQALRTSVPPQCKVSCKIRLPRSLQERDVRNRVLSLCETGVDFMTVHGRSLEENKTKTGPSHTDLVKVAVETAHDLPVILNGGVERHDDIERLLQETGAAAVMSSEALLETPNLFERDSFHLQPADLFQQQVSLAREYIQLCSLYPPLPGVLGGCGSFSIVKGHLFKMLHRYLQVHTDLRDQLARSTKLVHAMSIVDELESRYQQHDVEDWKQCPSSRRRASWYRRHWEANRSRVHQRGRKQPTQLKSVDERKEEMRRRIAKLQKDRLSKTTQQERFAV